MVPRNQVEGSIGKLQRAEGLGQVADEVVDGFVVVLAVAAEESVVPLQADALELQVVIADTSVISKPRID